MGPVTFVERQIAHVWFASMVGIAALFPLEWYLKLDTLTLSPITTEVYKWRDGSGNWHITGVPPETGTQYETLRYDSDQNILPLAPTSE